MDSETLLIYAQANGIWNTLILFVWTDIIRHILCVKAEMSEQRMHG